MDRYIEHLEQELKYREKAIKQGKLLIWLITITSTIVFVASVAMITRDMYYGLVSLAFSLSMNVFSSNLLRKRIKEFKLAKLRAEDKLKELKGVQHE